MRKVTLKSLTLTNFKGEPGRTTAFNADVTTISGSNGLGKSRHFDAFMWLLFGKDVQNRENYEVRSIVDGEPLHKVECSVTGVLDVDGEEITLKRAWVEDWVKPRKQVEQVLKGNHTECWWNETPVNVGEYATRIEAIVESSIFKMIMNPAFFVTMPWKTQREHLFMLAGTITDADVAAKDKNIAAFLDRLNGKSLEDFRKEIAFKKKNLKKSLDEIKPRVDQTHKMKPEAENWESLQAELDGVNAEIADIDKQIADHASRVRAEYDKQQGIQTQINDLLRKRQQLIFDAETKAREDAHQANAARREQESKVASLEREVKAYERELKLSETEVKNLHEKVDKLNADREKLLANWYAENGKNFNDSTEAMRINADLKIEKAKVFNGETVCPHCGQAIPQADQINARNAFESAKEARCAELEKSLAEANKTFNANKKSKLAEITASGVSIKASIEQVNESITEAEKARQDAQKRLDDAKANIEAERTKLSGIPETPAAVVEAINVPGVADLDKEVADLKATLSTDTNGDDSTKELQDKKADLNKKRDDLKDRLSHKDEIKRCDDEIASLEEQGKTLAQQIADLEKEEYTMRQFVKAKVEECEKRINAMFTHVSFRLFDYTIEGKQQDDPNEACVPLVGGIPYGSANTAGQVNAGLDIINVLCRFYGICAPIFIDNRESVNELIPMQSQIINLVVTTDNKLTIK